MESICDRWSQWQYYFKIIPVLFGGGLDLQDGLIPMENGDNNIATEMDNTSWGNGYRVNDQPQKEQQRSYHFDWRNTKRWHVCLSVLHK